jgi:two-component system, chemotaxis family, protein-glutamate methylesterase/glutaminase
VIAQDEESSVVWGMPGSIVKAGLASTVMPAAEIGPALRNLFGGSAQ